MGVTKLPPVAGFCLPGAPGAFISDPDFLEEIYVKNNAFFSKHPIEAKGGRPLLNATIVSKPSDDADYSIQRKLLSQAFMKDK